MERAAAWDALASYAGRSLRDLLRLGARVASAGIEHAITRWQRRRDHPLEIPEPPG